MLGCQTDHRTWGGEKFYEPKGLGTEEELWREERN